MNCRPGDLAVIVSGEDGWADGRVMRCVRLYVGASEGPCWIVDPALRDPEGYAFRGVADSVLRPIRDPGDDARDETLEWLPVPSKEVA